VELRWLRHLGAPIAGLAAVGLLVWGSGGATARIPPSTACTGSAGDATRALRAPDPIAPARLVGESWFRLQPRLDTALALAGQQLEIGWHGGASRLLDLPPESFAAGPFGRLVLVGADDGRRSTLRALDGADPCDWLLATEQHVIRRATIDPLGNSLYEFRVDRFSRADLGVWRRPLSGGASVRVVPPLPADDHYGPTFSTELSWSDRGDQLAVQSCGFTRCRTRLLHLASGAVRSVLGEDQGPLLGVAGGKLVGYGTCRGLPCRVRAIDLDSGSDVTLVEAAGVAGLVATEAGPAVAYEAGNGDAELVAVDVATGVARPVATLAPGLRLVTDWDASSTRERLPHGWALLSSADGSSRADARSVLVRLADGTTVGLAEVTP
jgi:hypothetical protein